MLRAATKAGVKSGRLDLKPDGTWSLIFGATETEQLEAVTDFDAWKRNRADKA